MQLEQLIQIVEFLKASPTLIDLRNSVLLQIGFFGAFRRSELVAINWEHITFVGDGIEIMIPRSKTDQSGEGQICAIPYGNDKLCPVIALKQWQEESGIEKGPIFRAFTKDDTILDRAIAPAAINIIIKGLAKRVGLAEAEKFSSHSLRRGFATCASRKGAPFKAIMRHGRWRSERTVLGYIEEGQRFEENAAGVILGKQQG